MTTRQLADLVEGVKKPVTAAEKAAVANHSFDYSWNLVEIILHAPKAPGRQDCEILSRLHLTDTS